MSTKKTSSSKKSVPRAKKKSAVVKKAKPAVRKKKGASRPAVRGPAVVGIGASAGGLEALEELFQNLPRDTGFAFVVITHQHPGHTSLLPELLGKCTAMSVVEAKDGTRAEADHVYIGPPGGYVAMMKGSLYLVEGPMGQMPPLPIDFFFRSLADDQRERSICVVLSGTGADGTLGLKAVKGEGGMAMVQDIQSARYAGMPSSAIATAQADYVMTPAAIPTQLMAYARVVAQYRPRPADAGDVQPRLEQPMRKIFLLMRARTGHDFSSYKPTTMRRRIERRMTVHQITEPETYVQFLQENPHELDILFKELLIGVTNFFRDPEAFKNLAEKVLPDLMRSRPDNYTFRVWIPGCGSGEEAYTIAILLRECMQKHSLTFSFQIFGTDLDSEAIETARSGLYPAGIAADVPADLLRRYFMEEDGAYRVRMEIREMIVFAPQNVIKDPPFTKLDLLSCRNLLIYLTGDLQQRLLPIFHYTLKRGGILMLGPSETVTGSQDLFTTVDKKWRLFRRKESVSAPALPEIPAQPVRDRDGPAGAMPVPTALPARPVPISAQLERLLLGRFAPPTVIVNERGDIIYTHGRTGSYLEPVAGLPRLNVLEMAREGLKIELAAALRQALAHEKDVVRERVRVRTNGDFVAIDLTVTRISEPESVRGLLVVSFRPSSVVSEVPAPKGKKGGTPAVSATAERVQALEREVLYTRESLQTTVEELETSNEELKSTNEELQSTNEELQSTNEELETSKEEMQSLNEELTTVNAELQSKLEELSRANDDMQNLLNSTDIATVFLDNDLNIKRYTDQARQLIKLIPTDVGRPVEDLVSELRTDTLAEDAREVLETLVRKEQEVESKDGIWYLMRMVPYRTADNMIEGLVITFVNIGPTKASELASRAALELLESAFDTVQHPSLVLDAKLRVVKANTSFCRLFSTTVEKMDGKLLYRAGGRSYDLSALREPLEDILPSQTALEDFDVVVKLPKSGRRTFRLNARQLERETGLPGMILLAMEESE